jgi:hypothetical protein
MHRQNTGKSIVGISNEQKSVFLQQHSIGLKVKTRGNSNDPDWHMVWEG